MTKPEKDHLPRFADDPQQAAEQVNDLICYGMTWTRIASDGTAHRVDPEEIYLKPCAE